MNEFLVPSTKSDITFSINIEGNWTLPDNTESTNSVLTIPNFSSHNEGVYKFYTNNWDGVEVCAIQILLRIAGIFASKVYFKRYICCEYYSKDTRLSIMLSTAVYMMHYMAEIYSFVITFSS